MKVRWLIWMTVWFIATTGIIGPVLAESAAVLPMQKEQAPAKAPDVLPTLRPMSVGDPAPTSTPPRPVAVRLEGIVTVTYSSLPGELLVDGAVVLVTAQTAISPSSYTPQVGDYVTIGGISTGTTLTATRIRINPEGEAANPVEFRGIIAQFPPDEPYVGEWIVGGAIVKVDNRAVVETPVLGYYAQVEGWIQQDRQILATRITVLDPQAISAQFQFEGPIQEIPGNVVGVWVIGGIRGAVINAANITGTPQVGARAEVSGRRTDSGLLVFEQVRVLPQASTRVAGLIGEINTTYGYWLIGSTQVDVDEMTFIDESRDRAAPGQWAEAIVSPRGPALYALRIRIERPE